MAWSSDHRLSLEAAAPRLVERAAQHDQVLAWVVAANIEKVGTTDPKPSQDLVHSGRILWLHPRVDSRVHHADAPAGHLVEANEVIGCRFGHGDQPVGAPRRVSRRRFEVPAGGARAGARLATAADVVDGDHRSQAEPDGQDMARDKGDVRPLATGGLPQPPMGPATRA